MSEDDPTKYETDYELRGVGTKAHARLLKAANKLVELMDDAESNHGGLWAGQTMRARDELRLELSRWKK